MERKGRCRPEARSDRLGDGPGGAGGTGRPAGAYVTNISDIDLLHDQFSVEMLHWTTWAGEPQADPSDQLMILNGIYYGDIQRFEQVIADG